MLAPSFVRGGQDKTATEKKEFALATHGSTFYSVLRRLFSAINWQWINLKLKKEILKIANIQIKS